MTELLAHLLGDYVFQSDWMALKKTTRSVPALAHALAYSAVFLLFFGPRWPAILVIGATHFFIDRFKLARYVIVAKNRLLAPPGQASKDINWNNGYPADTPPFLATWLFIIVDNTLHLLINHAALNWWFPLAA